MGGPRWRSEPGRPNVYIRELITESSLLTIAPKREGKRPRVFQLRRIRFENFDKEHWYGVDAVGPGGELAGYVRYRHERAAPPYSYDVHVTELCADDPDVAIGLWKLVGSSSCSLTSVPVVRR